MVGCRLPTQIIKARQPAGAQAIYVNCGCSLQCNAYRNTVWWLRPFRALGHSHILYLGLYLRQSYFVPPVGGLANKFAIEATKRPDDFLSHPCPSPSFSCSPFTPPKQKSEGRAFAANKFIKRLTGRLPSRSSNLSGLVPNRPGAALPNARF